MTMITINKGGTGEKTLHIDDIIIPDLWHVAMRLKRSGCTIDGEQVIEAWELLHALKEYIQS